MSELKTNAQREQGTSRARVAGVAAGVIIAVAGYLAPATLFCLGLPYLATLSGELPVYDPTEAESITWDTGNLLARGGLIALALWSVVILVFRRRLGLSGLLTFVVVAGALLATLVVAANVWFATLPPLTM